MQDLTEGRYVSRSSPFFKASQYLVAPCRYFIGNVFTFTGCHVSENCLQLHNAQREALALKIGVNAQHIDGGCIRNSFLDSGLSRFQQEIKSLCYPRRV